MTEKKYDTKVNISHSAVIGENVGFSHNLHQTIQSGIRDIVGRAKNYQNNSLPSRTGFVAEADHCATFNVRNALKRSSVRAIREPNGTHGDYKIVDGNRIIREGEIKYYNTPEQTENAMRGYGDRQLVGPADQVEDIRKIARQKAAKNRAIDKPSRQQVAREHEAVAENVSDCITDEKTKSTPRTYKEMRKLTKKQPGKKLRLRTSCHLWAKL